MRHDFLPEEIVLIKRYDKKTKKNIEKQFPVVGGRLRLFHLDLADDKDKEVAGGIHIDVVKYEDDVAVVKARVAVFGNAFTGIGMASKSRDAVIYPAILELAETRAIARALRFAGYGVEYTGAEEMPMDMITGGKADLDPEEKDPVKDPEPHKKGSEIHDAILDLRAKVWEHVKFTWKNYEENDLAVAMKVFMADIRIKSKDVSDGQIYAAIISRPDDFAKTYQKLLGTPEEQDKEPESPVPEKTAPDPGVDEIKKKAAAGLKMDMPDTGPSKEARRQKADIFMKLPAGVNAKAFNLTLEAIFKSNDALNDEQVYAMILGDFDSFIQMMIEFCAASSIDPGFSVTVNDVPGDVPDRDEKTETEESTKSYSDFHAQWVNLTWKPFNTFILKYCDEFRADENEYNAAVVKFDRLKVNNDAAEQRFPFLFKLIGETLSNDQSILEDEKIIPSEDPVNDGKAIAQMQKDFPKMCQIVSGAIGIAAPQNDTELALFLDEFDHQVHTYETKHKKPYTE
jgi:hypothetical protein